MSQIPVPKVLLYNLLASNPGYKIRIKNDKWNEKEKKGRSENGISTMYRHS